MVISSSESITRITLEEEEEDTPKLPFQDPRSHPTAAGHAIRKASYLLDSRRIGRRRSALRRRLVRLAALARPFGRYASAGGAHSNGRHYDRRRHPR